MVKIDKRKGKKTTPVKKKMMMKKNVQVQVEEKLQVQVKKPVKKKPKKLSKNKKLWLDIAPECKENGVSGWKTKEECIAMGFKWAKNGGPRRKGKMFGLYEYIWEVDKEGGGSSKPIKRVRTNGFDPALKRAEMLANRNIASWIKKEMKKKLCLHCNKKGCIPDHKNDLYNDLRVHNTKTQKLTDFQPLCNGCNIIKSRTFVKTEKEGKRQPAPFQLTSCGLPPFIKGDEKFDPDSIQGMVGTYWYDVAEYQQKARMMILNIN